MVIEIAVWQREVAAPPRPQGTSWATMAATQHPCTRVKPLKHYLYYWSSAKVMDWLTGLEDKTVNHIAGSQLARAEPGDVVWITTFFDAKLWLATRVVVGEKLTHDQACIRLGTSALSTSHTHLIPRPGTEVDLALWDITDIAPQIEFVSPHRHLPPSFTYHNLRTMRAITPDTARLLGHATRLWIPVPEPPGATVTQPVTTGVGRITAPDVKRAIELRAMAVAMEHFRKLGFSAVDVSRNESYDLVCRRSRKEIHAAVKGSHRASTKIRLTPDEVEHARQHRGHVILVVVDEIVIHAPKRPKTGATASGGHLRVFDPWDIDEQRLRAVGFEYTLGPAGRTK